MKANSRYQKNKPKILGYEEKKPKNMELTEFNKEIGRIEYFYRKPLFLTDRIRKIIEKSEYIHPERKYLILKISNELPLCVCKATECCGNTHHCILCKNIAYVVGQKWHNDFKLFNNSIVENIEKLLE
jgi:hypothetical protein